MSLVCVTLALVVVEGSVTFVVVPFWSSREGS